jgi:rSAM/selenodomain-associated transferase 2
MNAGARASRGEILVFLHADTILPTEADAVLQRALGAGARAWGRFDATIAGRAPMLAVISWFMNARSRLTGIATGDQAIFARRSAFEAAGGFPEIALMEDIALSKALKRSSPPACLRERVITSGRRWESRGTFATILLMWRLRLAYALGADPASLAARYGDRRPSA